MCVRGAGEVGLQEIDALRRRRARLSTAPSFGLLYFLVRGGKERPWGHRFLIPGNRDRP